MKIDDREIKRILQDDTVKMDDEQQKRLDFFQSFCFYKNNASLRYNEALRF